MPTVAVNAPKTPVHKGSNGIAMATLPNVCKMPGPPAPFVPVPLPNIGTSDNGPKGYSTSVEIEGNPVAIQGSSFLSKGDIASQGTGGGIVSMNVHGPTTFIGPGSLDVQIEGKNVQLLGDPMLNNCGPAGAPANSATMAGVLQAPLLLNAILNNSVLEVQHICDVICEVKAEGGGQAEISKRLEAEAPISNIKPEVPFIMNPADGEGPAPVMSKKDPSRATRRWAIKGSRRPDAILVDKSADPWRGDNIKAVVEIKLGNDQWGKGQEEAYKRIAGDPSKLILVTDGPGGCKCDTDDD
ncbi:MAG TPA: PAAR-like domain-containing protein, partial [Polyangiaceae bacterium]|nr:PAAR-like domain-containing protein [Polyangiaceae bacterium]